MSTNAPDHPTVESHSSYFEPESEALENMADVVTGQYSEIVRHRPAFPEIAGGLVAWALRMPAAPVCRAGRHYRGPGFRILENWCRLVDLGASETGNLVCRGARRERAGPVLGRPPCRRPARRPRRHRARHRRRHRGEPREQLRHYLGVTPAAQAPPMVMS